MPASDVIGRDAAEGLVELVRRSDRSVEKLPHAIAIEKLLSSLRP